MKTFNTYILPIILASIAALITAALYPLAGLYPVFFLAVVISGYYGENISGFIAAIVAIILIHFTIETDRALITEVISGFAFLGTALVATVLSRKQNKLVRELGRLESRAQQLADNHADAIITIDEGSNIEYANDSAGRMFGYAKEELVGKNMTDLMPERYRVAHLAGMSKYIKSKQKGLDLSSVKVEALTREGKEIKVEISFGEMFENGKKLFSAFLRDVTLQEIQKRELQESKERYETFIANSDEGIWRVELKNPIDISAPRDEEIREIYEDAYFAECNMATAKLYGYETPAEMIGKGFKEIVPDTIAKTVTSDEFFDGGYKSLNKMHTDFGSNGKIRYSIDSIIGIVEEGKLLRFWGMHREVTDEETQKIALIDSEQRFRLVTESVRDHAIISLDKDGIIMTWNIGAQRVYGYMAEEIVGKKVTILFPNWMDKESKLHEELGIALREGKWEGEEVRVHKDGSELFISIVITPLLDDSGNLKWFGKIDRDITERVNFVKQLEAKNAELVAVNISKDQFLATLSHELRTPLVSILGYANMLASNKLTPDAQVRAIETIARNTRLQVDLIEDLLDVSRIIAGKITLNRESLPLCSLISEIIETFRPQAIEKGLILTANFDECDVVVDADKRRVSQMLINLISNAIKFTPPKGSINVNMGPVDAEGCVIISFQDTGVGISEEMKPHLFERFRQADSSTTRHFSGLGLGLSIVKQLVELHDGEVWVDSEGEGKGSTFKLKLCCASRDSSKKFEPFLPIETMKTEFTLVGTKLLVVDDDEDTRLMLNDFFTRYGAEVVIASNAKEAREKAKVHKPDVFVFDIGMPDEDGYTLIRSFRAEGFLTPALALTAFVGKEYEEAALKAGFDAYIPKPASLDYLGRKVQELKDKNNR